MLETSNFPETCGSAGSSGGRESTVAAAIERISGDDGERSFGCNRWPREETLALLKIRSDMDVEFRDPNPKIARWMDVSRKLAELGYHRTAKKCKEKFENIYKYHKRTKEGRSGRQNGKNYRFFDQLEIFDHNSLLPSPSSDKTADIRMDTTQPNLFTKPITSVSHENILLQENSFKNRGFEFMSTASTSATSNSSKDSSGRRVRKKRKLEAYLESLMNEVLHKQEILQNKFIEAIEKSESNRAAREESWKIQEMARMNREKEILAQERAVAAAKDAAVIAFLQKISDQNKPSVETRERIHQDVVDTSNNSKSIGINSSSRWPRVEVEALIRVRTNLDLNYQDNNGAKGSLWEEISMAMNKLGYTRNAKRCKEKWENINKYYKRVKESKKKRPEDSKTCPYFHMLDNIYEMKSRKVDGSQLKAEEILMQMMNREREQEQEQSMTDNGESENVDDRNEEDGEENAVDEDDDNGENYQVVVNNNKSDKVNNNNCITSLVATRE
jgi:hypothetical protein